MAIDGLNMKTGDKTAGRDSSLRVALFTDSNVFAGTERHILDLATGLCSAGVEASIACPGGTPLAERAREGGIRHIPIEKRGFFDWAAIRTLRRKLRSGELNLIHSHNGRTALSAAFAVKSSGFGSYVLTQHFLVPSRSARRGLKAVLSGVVHRWISRGAGHIIAISDASRRGIEERGESVNGNVTTVPNGISAPDSRRLAGAADVRAGLGVNPTQPLIVCAARLEKEKDVSSLIAAMATVVTVVREAICIIAGSGSQRERWPSRSTPLGFAIPSGLQASARMRFP